jgi:hypothetical protein
VQAHELLRPQELRLLLQDMQLLPWHCIGHVCCRHLHDGLLLLLLHRQHRCWLQLCCPRRLLVLPLCCITATS